MRTCAAVRRCMCMYACQDRVQRHVHSAAHDGGIISIVCTLPVTPFLSCVKSLTALLLTRLCVAVDVRAVYLTHIGDDVVDLVGVRKFLSRWHHDVVCAFNSSNALRFHSEGVLRDNHILRPDQLYHRRR